MQYSFQKVPGYFIFDFITFEKKNCKGDDSHSSERPNDHQNSYS